MVLFIWLKDSIFTALSKKRLYASAPLVFPPPLLHSLQKTATLLLENPGIVKPNGALFRPLPISRWETLGEKLMSKSCLLSFLLPEKEAAWVSRCPNSLKTISEKMWKQPCRGDSHVPWDVPDGCRAPVGGCGEQRGRLPSHLAGGLHTPSPGAAGALGTVKAPPRDPQAPGCPELIQHCAGYQPEDLQATGSYQVLRLPGQVPGDQLGRLRCLQQSWLHAAQQGPCRRAPAAEGWAVLPGSAGPHAGPCCVGASVPGAHKYGPAQKSLGGSAGCAGADRIHQSQPGVRG